MPSNHLSKRHLNAKASGYVQVSKSISPKKIKRPLADHRARADDLHMAVYMGRPCPQTKPTNEGLTRTSVPGKLEMEALLSVCLWRAQKLCLFFFSYLPV